MNFNKNLRTSEHYHIDYFKIFYLSKPFAGLGFFVHQNLYKGPVNYSVTPLLVFIILFFVSIKQFYS